MTDLHEFDHQTVVDAVLLWTGKRSSPFPLSNDLGVINQFGQERGAKLLQVLKTLKNDFYASNAHLVTDNLNEMGELAKRHFNSKHPEFSSEVVDTFAWCYTFDHR